MIFIHSWTVSDARVVCRQLGFDSPLNDYFTYNFTATDYHKFIAITQPNCTGSENRLLDCPGAQAPKYSSQICSKCHINSSNNSELLIFAMNHDEEDGKYWSKIDKLHFFSAFLYIQ